MLINKDASAGASAECRGGSLLVSVVGNLDGFELTSLWSP